jgi:hypothetical protein
LVMPCGVTVGSLEPVGGVTPVTGPFTGGTTGVFGLLAVGGVTPVGLLEGFGPTPGTLEPGAVIVVGSTLGMALEGVLTAAAFKLTTAGGSTETGASKAMLELKLLEDTVLDGVDG